MPRRSRRRKVVSPARGHQSLARRLRIAWGWEDRVMERTSRGIVFVLAALVLTAGCSKATDRASSTTTTLPAGDRQVVIAESSASPRGQVSHRVAGRVTDIDRASGQITVRTPEGSSMKLMLPPIAVATVREGDDVALDISIVPRAR
jgi:hypothetical protein